MRTLENKREKGREHLTINEMQERVNTNRRLVHQGRWVNLTFVLGVDDDDHRPYIYDMRRERRRGNMEHGTWNMEKWEM